jgi:small GTP-binding protein
MSNKVILTGPSSVGKTTIVTRLNNQSLSHLNASTIGCAFSVMEEEGSTFEIWDTAGQERYMSICPMYYRNAHIVIFVFDVSDPRTIDQLGVYVDIFFKTQPLNSAKFIFIGNKLDRDHICETSLRERIIYNQHIRQYFELVDAPIIFVSALENRNIDQLRQKLVEYAVKNLNPSSTVSLTEATASSSYCYSMYNSC